MDLQVLPWVQKEKRKSRPSSSGPAFSLSSCPRRAHLVNEGGKLVVEGLDLLPLLSLYLPNLGVDLHIEGLQEALVDSHFLDSPREATWAKATRATKATSPFSKATNSPSKAPSSSTKAPAHPSSTTSKTTAS